MKNVLFVIGMCCAVDAVAQCPNDNTQFGPTYDVQYGAGAEILDTCFYAGNYALVNVVEGNLYTFTTCGDEDFDTEITLYMDLGGWMLAYNDDACTFQSSVSWVATFTGQVRVLVDRFPCGDQNECMMLRASCSSQCTYNVPFSGDTMVVTCSGTVCDHAGDQNYSPGANGYIVFVPSVSGKVIQLQGAIDSETYYDGIFVYDSVGTTGSNLGTWSGHGELPVFTSLSGPITLRFVSDAVDQYSGFSLDIACVEPLSVEPVVLNNYQLWPSPNDGNFNVQFRDEADAQTVFTITDNSGRQVSQEYIAATGVDQTVSLHRILAPGMYYLIIQGKHRKTMRFCVQ